ncbi:uncharacterized protein N7518_003174 [Penicillium psychrosexuale]|uniref:uncharacterized protein n=1 Tax=Penicillium psychrosexuale TaxID=1002107 RepID=UPI0025459D7B|nr:uncharacterized protein N7518_003174 [Penicillium psychrosexuale]KAJ5801106.1 hypothetical protein N7518_003174 [Penicillium psychrosexuale]
MRIWAFDRLGGIASEHFDINEDGLQLISTILGFLWMSEADCGFDPTITMQNGRQIIEIERNGQTERLILDSLMKRAPCIAGRATTCWKAYLEADPRTSLVVKDSWQYTERDEEGELLKEATERGVANVSRYYHHLTVYVRGKADGVRDNVRGGLDIRTETIGPNDWRSRLTQAHLMLRDRVVTAAGPARNALLAKQVLLYHLVSDPARHLQSKYPTIYCQIESIGVSSCATLANQFIRQALPLIRSLSTLTCSLSTT